jgi:capsular exopolysaccharide synthesis family protein
MPIIDTTDAVSQGSEPRVTEIGGRAARADREPRQWGGLSFAPRPGGVREEPAGTARLVDIDTALRVISRHRWLVLGTLAVALGIAVVITVMATREYRSVATLQINAQPAQIIGSRSQPLPRLRNDDQYLQTQYGILRSRALAERVARDLKLAENPGFVDPAVPQAQRMRAAADRLAAYLEVVPLRGSDLVVLGYTDPDPALSAKIANGFAEGFIAATTENRYNTTAYARTFLQDQLAIARQRLENSERALVTYAQGQGIVQLEGGSGGGSRERDGPSAATGDTLSSQTLVTLNTALSDATSERIAAEQAYRQAAGQGGSTEQLADPALQALRGEQARLEADYSEKLKTFKPDYPDMLALKARIAEFKSALARETGAINTALASRYRAAAGRERDLQAKVSQLRAQVLDLRNRGIGYNFLQREVDTNRELYDALLQRYKEIGVVGELGESQATVIDRALAPTFPYRPQPLLNLGIALVLGLIGGLALAFLFEFIDDTIKSPDELSEVIDLPVLGVVPRMGKGERLAEQLEDPKSPITESYQSAVAGLRFVGEGGVPRSLLVTSSRPSEGKSSSSLAIAQSLARVGKRVLLIDADMRNPSFTSESGEVYGLSTLLANAAPLANHALPTRIETLWLLPAGPIPGAPAHLLATLRIHEIIAEAEAAYDVVIVDAPPVLGLVDAPMLASICDATVLVVEAGSARRTAVKRTLRRLFDANARVVGMVLTKFYPKSVSDHEHYGYGYGYGYGRSDGAARGGVLGRLRGRGRDGNETLDIGA